MKAPCVYILVLNYCSLVDTIACVESIRGITYPNCHLLVIDNMSPDGSGKELKKHFPPAEFLELPVNQGYAGGNNVGIRMAMEAGADYVFVVNPDVRLPADSIKHYVNVMQADSSISALNPVQLSADQITIDEFFRREMFDHNGYKTPIIPLDPDHQWDVKSIFGAALLLSRNTIERVGGFDPLYFAYWEEIDLCRRIKHHGGRLVVTGAAPVVHLRSYKSRGHDPFRAYLRLKGSYLYRLKDVSRSYSALLRNTLVELARNIVSPEANKFGWGRREYFKTFIWISMNFIRIRQHRRMDVAGAAYL